VQSIDDYVQVTEFGHVKDHNLAEQGGGFVVVDGDSISASISTNCAVAHIALLEFLPDVPRGHHYHVRKIEFMTVLKGRMKCDLKLASDPTQAREIILESGQMVRILPGCIHTYTALEDRVIAIEFSPQKVEMADFIFVR
jgi:mannose-6-phosphate isomerase-like protein (cupin superfamily)